MVVTRVACTQSMANLNPKSGPVHAEHGKPKPETLNPVPYTQSMASSVFGGDLPPISEQEGRSSSEGAGNMSTSSAGSNDSVNRSAADDR
jgi:hypothetical protein